MIRQVCRHSETGLWAYIEWSDENKLHHVHLGTKDFPTREEAEDYALGFAGDSYEWKEPNEIKVKRLRQEKEKLIKRLADIDNEFFELGKIM